MGTKDLNGSIKEETSIALIRKDIAYIQADISDIKTVLKEGYATKDSLATVARETETRLTRLENSSTIYKVVAPLLSSLLSSVVTFLAIQYLAHS